MAYYCLHKFHWPPSKFLALPNRERAFITAAVMLRIKTEKKQRDSLNTRASRGRRRGRR